MINIFKITGLERAFLNQIIESEFAEFVDGEQGWVGDYVSDLDYDMKKTRGVMSSLEKKGVICVGKPEKALNGKTMMTWVSIETKYIDFDECSLDI